MKATAVANGKSNALLPNQQASEVIADLPQMTQVSMLRRKLPQQDYRNHDAVLQLVSTRRHRIPLCNEFKARRVRLRKSIKDPVAVTMLNGCNAVQVQLNHREAFASLTKLREALDYSELKHGGRLAIDFRNPAGIGKLTRLVTYAASVHSTRMPRFGASSSKNDKHCHAILHNPSNLGDISHAIAAAEANTLCRQLCILPGNILTAERFIKLAAETAKIHSFEYELFDRKKLKKINANLFLAVSGMSSDAGLVRLSYRCGNKNSKRVALLGKGVCFDTGGINLKQHKHMLGMQGDMAGAAATLGALIAAKRLRLNIDLDVWLAVAENLISVDSMKPGDTLTSHSGKTVEIVHTDAEGRMMLADGLSIIRKTKPDIVVTLATLTGSMVNAVGSKMSGVAGTDTEVELAKKIGDQCGERLMPFPLPLDYFSSLKSEVADILQCSAGSEPDHILAGLFLKEFVGGLPWLHLDLSASTNKGGLGAVPTSQTGFGAAWLVDWLEAKSKIK